MDHGNRPVRVEPAELFLYSRPPTERSKPYARRLLALSVPPRTQRVRCCWTLCAVAWPAYREHCRSLSARGRPGVREMSSPRRGCFHGGPLVSSSPSLRRRCRRGFLGCRLRKPSGRSLLECSGQASRNISSRGACPWRRLRSRRILRWPPCATGLCQPRCLRRTVRATGALTSTPAQLR